MTNYFPSPKSQSLPYSPTRSIVRPVTAIWYFLGANNLRQYSKYMTLPNYHTQLLNILTFGTGPTAVHCNAFPTKSSYKNDIGQVPWLNRTVLSFHISLPIETTYWTYFGIRSKISAIQTLSKFQDAFLLRTDRQQRHKHIGIIPGANSRFQHLWDWIGGTSAAGPWAFEVSSPP